MEELSDYIIMKRPILQGLQNRIDLKNVGKEPFDIKNVRKAISIILDEKKAGK